MWQAVASVASLLLGVGFLQSGTGLYGSFLPLRMEHEGFLDLAIGGIGSAYFLGFVAGTLQISRLIGRVGHIRTFATLAAALSLLTLVQALEVSAGLWAASRLAQGFCVGGLFVVAESWINDRTETATRGQVFSVYMILSYTALGLSQFLLPLVDVAGDRHFLITAILFSACLLPVALSPGDAPPVPQIRRFSLHRLIAISPLGMAGSFASGAVNGAYYAIAPVYAARQGLEQAQVAGLMGSVIIAGLVLQWPVGKLSDVFDRRTILVVLAAATAGVAGLLGFVADLGFWVLLGLASVYGGLAFTIYPVAVAHANDHVAREDMILLAAGLLLAYGVGASAGPLLASTAIGVLGGRGFWLYIATAAALLALFGLWRMTQRPAVPMAEQGPFLPVARTSPVIQQLDPRLPANDDGTEDVPGAQP